MTIEEIKKELPNVKVKVPNGIITAHICGRQLKFPKVVVIGEPNLSWEFSWSAIEHAINTDTALIV